MDAPAILPGLFSRWGLYTTGTVPGPPSRLGCRRMFAPSPLYGKGFGGVGFVHGAQQI